MRISDWSSDVCSSDLVDPRYVIPLHDPLWFEVAGVNPGQRHALAIPKVKTMLEASAVSKVFGNNRALDAVTLRVEPGEIYCLLGANGAGKTTLVNLFLDFLEPTSGEVRTNGGSVSQHPIECKKIGNAPGVE